MWNKIILAALLMTACTTTSVEDAINDIEKNSYDESTENEVQKKRVNFSIEGIGISITKTSLTETGANYLYVYENGEEIMVQTRDDDDFGRPSLLLDFGEHDITFVASVYELSDEENQLLSGEVFGRQVSVVVDENTETQSVSLKRIKTGLRVVVNNVNQSKIRAVELVVARVYTALSPGELYTGNYVLKTIQIPLSGTLPASVVVYSFCPVLSEVFNVNCILRYMGDDDVVLMQRRFTAPLMSNRVTSAECNWSLTDADISVDTEWEDDYSIGI